MLIAGVVLLFTGRYPRGLFDFVLGHEPLGAPRRRLRALMTDAYPPFRLDQGGTEPGSHRRPRPAKAPSDAGAGRLMTTIAGEAGPRLLAPTTWATRSTP